MTLTVGSLFSGIGGLDLGLERAGMKVIWQSEIDPYATRVLAKHWPEVPNLGDIKRINFPDVVRPDVICGGYPCQPFSTAGQRKGEEDPRHLWPWVREALRVLRPRYAILENVRGHLSLGGTTVLSEIATLGYSAEWRVVSAASVGANHRRDRIVIVAYTDDSRVRASRRNLEPQEPSSCEERKINTRNGISGRGTKVADATGERLEECSSSASREIYASDARWRVGNLRPVADWWKIEPNVGRVANGISSRLDRLRGLGNAVVPQVAEVIGRLVVAHADQNPD